MADERLAATDEEIERKIQSIHRERRELNELARWWHEELDRRIALDRYAQALAEQGDVALEALHPSDHDEVRARAGKWASSAQGPELELPAPPAPQPRWHRWFG